MPFKMNFAKLWINLKEEICAAPLKEEEANNRMIMEIAAKRTLKIMEDLENKHREEFDKVRNLFNNIHY